MVCFRSGIHNKFNLNKINLFRQFESMFLKIMFIYLGFYFSSELKKIVTNFSVFSKVCFAGAGANNTIALILSGRSIAA